MMEIEFKGECLSGKCNLDTTKMVCVPAKEKYNEVDICLKSANETGANVSVCVIDGLSLPYDQKKILGYEIARRWNELDRLKQENVQLKQQVEFYQEELEKEEGLLIECINLRREKAKLIEALKPFTSAHHTALGFWKASQTMKEVCGEEKKD